eukprot:CAMPEP_0116128404 /NCGR_PEP_ID=MMETSP0329-20121206/7343_1 /TAXON_ID=697910 /ORGANISM="Pseudo-nitzschia arenysensis, Strain B593" /LENGTH=644 /DNA_ID=CAMNT_0003622543 /DNA_START=302 /DNA_END=2236 /DNA_ORIENTATION=-
MVTEGDAVNNAAVCDEANIKDERNSSSSSLSSLVKGDTTALSTKDNEEWLELPEDFTPSKMDVIVGWARQNYHHEGNKMLRNLVRENVPRYMAARTKHDKGTIIVDILEAIRRESPTGVGLVRQNPETGRWSYIGNDKAKDKIGHALRKSSRDYHKMRQNGHRRRPSPSYRSWPPHSHASASISAQSAQSGGIRGTIDNNTSGKNKLQLYATTTTATSSTSPTPPPSSTTASTTAVMTASTTSSRHAGPPVVPSSVSSGRIRHASPPPPGYPYHYPPPPHSHHPHYPPSDRQHHEYYYSRQPSHHHRYPPPSHYAHAPSQHPHYPPPPPPSGSNYNNNDDPHHPSHSRSRGFQAIHPSPPQSSPPAHPRTPVHVSSCSTSSFAPSAKNSNNEYNIPVREVSVPKRPNSVNSNISSKSSGSSTRSSPSSAGSPKIAKPFYTRPQAGYHHPSSGESGSPIRFGYSSSHCSGHGSHHPSTAPPPSHHNHHSYPGWEDRHAPKDHPPASAHPDHAASSYQPKDPHHHSHVSHHHGHSRGPREEAHDYRHPEAAPVSSSSSFHPPAVGADDLDDQHVSHRIFDEVEEQRRETEDKHNSNHHHASSGGDSNKSHHPHPAVEGHHYAEYHAHSAHPPPAIHHHPPPPHHHY